MNPVVIVYRSDTRRKACTGCVKAKRRCDLTLPACSRCKARDLGCQYADSAPAITDEAMSLPNDTALATWPTLPTTSAQDQLMDPRMDDIFLSPYDSFPFPEIVPVDPYQIGYCVFEIKRCVETLVLESRTPFIHPVLYEDTMADTYQDLVGMCSFYMQRTSQNRPNVYRMMDGKVKKLIDSTKSVIRIEDWLLTVQTFIMYQIIRLFDGDMRQRQNAEREMRILHVWTEKLQLEYSQADIAPCQPGHDWIVLESIRRTVMVSWLIRGFYQATTEGVCRIVPALTSLLVSDNSEAWDGNGVGLNTNLLSYPDFVDRWNIGKISSFNVYEMILLKACPRARINGVSRWGRLLEESVDVSSFSSINFR